jgi:hypothetical protein
MANQELAKTVLDHILAHPGQHNQGFWGQRTECGTTMCVAGWTCELAGERLVWEPNRSYAYDSEGVWYTKNGEYIPVRAAKLLDLTDYEADTLFYTNKDTALRNLKHLADTGSLED